MSQIILKLVETFDIEFIQYSNAENPFLSNVKKTYDTSKPNIKSRNRKNIDKFITSLMNRSFYLKPTNSLDIYQMLIDNSII